MIYIFIKIGDLSVSDLFSERVPRLSESPLLIAQFRGSSHGCQQRHDGTPLLIKGHQKGLKDLRNGQEPLVTLFYGQLR